MDTCEKQMQDMLAELKESYGAAGIKIEFEEEGTSFEEAVRVKEIALGVGLHLTAKIGGCKAIKDINEAKLLGVSKIAAPMIESPFALRKFVNAAKSAYASPQEGNVKLFINIETITAYKFIDEILESSVNLGLDGIVVGRGDLTESAGLGREYINSEEIFNISSEIILKAKKQGLLCGIGGGVSVDSIPFFEKLSENLDFYETRKIIFDSEAVLGNNPEKGILKAIQFELMWLRNKQNCFSVSNEDRARINMLESNFS